MIIDKLKDNDILILNLLKFSPIIYIYFLCFVLVCISIFSNKLFVNCIHNNSNGIITADVAGCSK